MPAGKSYKTITKKSSAFVVEALFPTLRGFNPLAGDSSPAAEEKPQPTTSSAERGG